jgi:hypothetical protein
MTSVARFSKPARRAVSGYLPYSVDRPGNRTPISWLQARHLPVGRAAQDRCRGMTNYQAPLTKLGIFVFGACLVIEIRSLVICQQRVRGSHPACGAYEARLGAGPPA